MLRWVLRRMVESMERKWNYDATYLKEIIDISPRAAWLFARTSSLGNYRRDVPVARVNPRPQRTASAITRNEFPRFEI
jgi:hypothetical protein